MRPVLRQVPANEIFGPAWKKEWILHFVNCYLLRNHELVDDDLWVQNGVVLDPADLFFGKKLRPDFQIDCRGAIISYGFIDLQINGAFGVDFSDETDDLSIGIRKVARGLLSHGVVAFCPTIVTSRKSLYQKLWALDKLRSRGGIDGSGVLGLHLEGPFISPSKRGAHPVDLILPLANGRKDAEDVYGHDLENVAIVTIAPELPGAIDVIDWLVQKGVVVLRNLWGLYIICSSFARPGHSTSSLTIAEEAVNHGASLITHLFNAMPPFHHRDPGLIGLLASSKLAPGRRAFFGIISDGIHTHPAALRIAYRAHFDGLILVTDAVPPMGLGDGEYDMGPVKVRVEGTKATVSGTEIIAGSIATMDMCVRHFKKSAKCSTVEALEAATLHPAEAMGLAPKMGTLEPNSQADFVLLSDDLVVKATFIEGRCVHTAQPSPDFTVFDLREYA